MENLINLILLVACLAVMALLRDFLRELRRIDGTIRQMEIIIDQQAAKIQELERK